MRSSFCCSASVFQKEEYTVIVKNYMPAYLPYIVALEEKNYPPALQLGEAGFRAELEKMGGASMVVFRDGKVVGYIIAYQDESEPKYTYISDLNCKDKRALWWLLVAFFSRFQRQYTAECRPESLMLLKKKYRKSVSVTHDISLPNYYAPGEHAHKIKFYVNPDHMDVVALCARHIVQSVKMESIMDLIEHVTSMGMDVRDPVFQKRKITFLRLLNEHNLQLYRMFGKDIPISIRKVIPVRTEKHAENYAKALLEGGFIALTDTKSTVANDNELRIYANGVVYQYGDTIFNDKTFDDLSSARHILRYFYDTRCKSATEYAAVFDRYGNSYQEIGPPPYCTRNTWDYTVRREADSRRLEERVAFSRDSEYHDYLNSPSIRLKKLTKVVGYRDAVRVLDHIVDEWERVPQEHRKNCIHDWNTIINELLDERAYLTKGAYLACLCGTYNEALKKKEIISSVSASLKGAANLYPKKNKVISDLKKEVRKQLSRTLRVNGSLTEYRDEVIDVCGKILNSYYKLSRQETASAQDFIVRMRRYNPNINVPQFFSVFGKAWTKRVLTGKVNGLFEPRQYRLGDHYLCREIRDIFQTRSKRAKGVYNDLRAEGCLEAVLNTSLTVDQRGQVIDILKKRNCKLPDNALLASKFRAEVEPKCSPEYLIAGDASVCCMRFGASNARQYALEEGFGILNIYYKNRIIANSVLWIEDQHKCLVLDNIEVHKNYTKYNSLIEELYQVVLSDLVPLYQLQFAVQGDSYSDLRLQKLCHEPFRLNLTKARSVGVDSFYSDARRAFVVSSLIPESELMVMIENQADIGNYALPFDDFWPNDLDDLPA